MGATDFGYRVARQFDLPLTQTRAGLVPLTFSGPLLEALKPMAGISVPARVCAGDTGFEEGLLITHRGLSGPSILQISSYWEEGEDIRLHIAPGTDIIAALKAQRKEKGRMDVATALSAFVPGKLAHYLIDVAKLTGNLADQADRDLVQLEQVLTQLALRPSGTEGYRTAEVTLGGVDTRALNSQSMEAKGQAGLYFIGEVVDVTGWLGGYNFQWAWSSAWVAGQAIRAARQN